ncbi:hypothetical protein BX616_001430, partial [Lobosporangium transversale]
MQRAATETAIDEDDEEMDDETEWIEVQRTKERFFVATAPVDLIYGDTYAMKRDELQQILIHQGIHCTEGPTRIKNKDGQKVFRVAVETLGDLENLLELTHHKEDEENGTSSEQPIFTRVDQDQRITEQDRSVEIYGLHPRTDDFRIKSAMAQFGE